MTDTSSPSPPGVADFDDDAPLVERLDGSAPPPSPDTLRSVSRIVTFTILVALLLLGVIHVWSQPSGIPATATLSDIPSGWLRRGPADTASIAFGQSPPTVGYACGPDSVPPGSFPAHAINLYGSADGGSTWRELSFQIAGLPTDGGVHGFFGVSCVLSVDPVDAKDVALLVEYQACGQGFANALYRSRDGGATWLQMTLPAWDSSGEQSQASAEIAWAGAKLYVAALEPCGAALNRVAVSANDDAFTWVNNDDLIGNDPADVRIGSMTSSGSYVYIREDFAANCTQTCAGFKRTDDGGQTWDVFAPEWQGRELTLLDGAAQTGAHSLFAQYVPDGQDICSLQRTYYRSTNDGATWAELPQLPTGLVVAQAQDAPDGAVYAEVTGLCGESAFQWGIYRLDSSDALWVRIAEDPQATITLNWNQDGRPAGLWATPLIPPGVIHLIYHAA